MNEIFYILKCRLWSTKISTGCWFPKLYSHLFLSLVYELKMLKTPDIF